MDVASLLTVLLLALGLAVQPWSVLAGVLLVTADRGVAKLAAYVAGWVLALVVVAAIAVAVYPAAPTQASGSPAASWVEIGLGVLLGGWLVVRRARAAAPTAASTAASTAGEPDPAAAAAASQPAWMGRLDSMSPAPAFVLGAFLPNYVLVVAGVDEVLQAQLSKGTAALVMLCFVLVASAGVAAPFGVMVARGSDAPAVYRRWREWLVANGQAVVTVVLAFLAVALVAKGVVGLL